MKQGKYDNRRRGNPLLIVFWIIFIVFIILGSMVLLKSCGGAKDVQTPPATIIHDETQDATPETSEQPTEAPTVAPTTEPATEPATEATTEPTTQPTEPSETTAPAPQGTLAERIVATAKSVLGKPYAKAGNGPDGFDTSGLVSYCFKECGVSVPRKTSAQYAHGKAVEKDDLQAGDVVFFYLETPGSADYMGIYTGNNTFITVSSSENAVIERKFNTTYHKEHYVGARRYITAE